MAKQTINIGTSANSKDGDIIRDAFNKVNQNFTELYANTDLSAVAQHILPAATETYDLGSDAKRWRTLYVSENTVYFGDKALSINQAGGVEVDGVVIATPGGASANADWNATSGQAQILNKPVLFSGSYDDLTDTPTIPSITGLATETYVNNAVGAIIVPDVSNFITAEDIPAIPADISDLTDTTNLLQPSSVVNGVHNITMNASGDFIPNSDILQDLGSPTNRFRHVYVGPGSVYIGNNVITESATGGLVLPGVTRATGYYAEEVDDEDDWGSNPIITGTVTVIDATRYQILAGQTPSVNYVPATYTVQKDGNRIDEINVSSGGSGWTKAEADYARNNNMYATNVVGAIDNFNAGDWQQIPFRVEIKAEDTEYEDIFGGGTELPSQSGQQGKFLTTDGEDLSWTDAPGGEGGTTLPSQTGQEGKFLRTDGEDLSWVAMTGGSLTVGNGTSTSVENVTEILFNGTITEIEPGLVGVTIAGTEGGTIQPYLELTNTPFITQPAVLGTPVTVTAAPTGNGALLSLTITAGPTLDVETIGIDSPGTGYVVGQRYIINYWQIGGNNDDSSIEFEVDSVGEEGELLTVINAAFGGGLAANTPATYTGVSVEYRPSVFDEVDAGLTLTRGQYNGLFNSEEEFSHNSSVSPTGTLWNSEGWGNLLGLGTRDYEIFDSFNPDQLTTLELVMWDTVNDKHYKFDITEWNNDTGAYAYTRTLITDPNYFRKTDNGNEVDIIIADDGNGAGVGITRDGNNGIYNPYREGSWDSDVSPGGIGWNIDGWDDLTDVESRTYINFYAAYGFGGLGNKVPGSKAVIYVPDNGKYYAIDWISWTQGINGNPQGGGFSYTRREIDLDKLTQGITFADGTVQTTAYVDTNVVSTAPGQRRIETASGYNQVSVTQRVTNNYTGAINATTNGYELRIARTTELDAILVPIDEGTTNATFTLSFDNVTFREVYLSSIQPTEYWFYYQNDLGQTTPQTEDDPVYLTVTTGGDSVAWWSKNELPGGSDNFRGAVIDYHAYTGDGTIIGTIHIVDDDGEEYITHTEVSSGSTDSMNNDLWIVTTEGTIRYGRFDGEASTLKIHWTAKVFYGDELYD